MATRTITKTKTKVKAESKLKPKVVKNDPDEGTDSEDEKRKFKLRKPRQSLVHQYTPAPLSGSDAEDEDDFAADSRAEIEEDKKRSEILKQNGGRKPRKKKEQANEAEQQTSKTRQALKKGQDREDKTAKWLIRERRRNPLIKLLEIDLEILASDSSSSDGSINSDNVDGLSDYSKEVFQNSHRRRKKRQLKKEEEKHKLFASFDSEEDKPAIRDDSNEAQSRGKGKAVKVKRESDGSATEDSDDVKPVVKVKKEEKDWSFMDVEEDEDKKPVIKDEDSESDWSDDVSPLDAEAYQAQLRRRKERDYRATAKAEGQPIPPKPGVAPSASTSRLPQVKKEEDFDNLPNIKQERRNDGHALEISDDDDEEMMPDLPMDDPRYIAWTQRTRDKGKQRESQERNFEAYYQEDAKPHFQIKSAEQAAVRAFPLGEDEDGKKVEIPAAINRFLRSYQRDGVRFFWEHYRRGEGGLLGDDMGLGKTIQVISFLVAIMHHKCTEQETKRRMEQVKELGRPDKATDYGPTALVIAPASVVDNWAREIATWSNLSAEVYRPGQEKTKEVLRNFKRGRLDIVICGVDAARNHIDDISHLDFSCIFIDEVHKVKNPKSETSIAFKQFVCQRRFGLTGTAMQNRYAELHTVLDWCFPGRLGDRSQWKDYVETPLKDAQRKDASQKQLATGRTRAIALVHYLLPHFFVRRTKELIADQLPKKFDNIVFCPLTDDQARAYKRCLAHPEVQIILTHDEPCPCGRTDNQGLPYARGKCCEEEWYKPILKWITIFSKVANHAVLIYPDKRDLIEQPPKYAQDKEITRWAFPDSYKNRGPERTASTMADMDTSLCGKWPVLRDLLARWKGKGDKVLIFSRSTRLLDALQYWIDSVGYNMVRLDGKVEPSKRLDICDQFNDPNGGIFIFLISTLAGGVGLNLTSANRVVIFDPNWNPVADLQAMDRSYRWGQTRDVYVYRLIGAGSIEELIYTRQIYKQHQAEIAYDAANPSRMFMGVQDDKKQQGELFGVKNLFRFNESANRTKHSIEQAQISEMSYALMNHAAQVKSKGKKRKRGDDDDETSELELDQDEEGTKDGQAVLDAMLGKVKVENGGEDDEISQILKDNGVAYTHQHSNLVKHSAMEATISKAAMRDFRNAEKRGQSSNQRASTAKREIKIRKASAWAPTKGKAGKAVKQEEPSTDPFEMLFEGGNVKGEELAELAEALDYGSAAAMAKDFASMTKKMQSELLVKAKEIVERI